MASADVVILVAPISARIIPKRFMISYSPSSFLPLPNHKLPTTAVNLSIWDMRGYTFSIMARKCSKVFVQNPRFYDKNFHVESRHIPYLI